MVPYRRNFEINLRRLVFIHSGSYSGFTGVVTDETECMYVVDIKDYKVVRLLKSSCTLYHHDDTNMYGMIDAAAFRCVQEVLKHNSPIDTRTCICRFKQSIKRYFDRMKPDVILEGEREHFRIAKPINPIHIQDMYLHVRKIDKYF